MVTLTYIIWEAMPASQVVDICYQWLSSSVYIGITSKDHKNYQWLNLKDTHGTKRYMYAILAYISREKLCERKGWEAKIGFETDWITIFKNFDLRNNIFTFLFHFVFYIMPKASLKHAYDSQIIRLIFKNKIKRCQYCDYTKKAGGFE